MPLLQLQQHEHHPKQPGTLWPSGFTPLDSPLWIFTPHLSQTPHRDLVLLPRLQENGPGDVQSFMLLYQFLHTQINLSKNMTWHEIPCSFPAQEGHWSLPRAVARTVTTIPSSVGSCLWLPKAGAHQQLHLSAGTIITISASIF